MAKRRKTRRASPQASRAKSSTAADAIFSPALDVLLTGGFSIIILGTYTAYALATGTPGQARINLGDLIILQALINWPHFMASYRLLYATPEIRNRHRFASYAVPALLIALGAFAVFGGDQPATGGVSIREDVTDLLFLIAGVYLAWHYTGQAWGMVASFAYLSGLKMTSTERIMIRSGLRVLLVWHVAWGIHDNFGPLTPYVPQIQIALVVFVIASLIAGTFAFASIARRTRKPVPLRMVVPWVATYVWYVALYVDPATFLLVQLAHALQYLPFPFRVEINRSRMRGSHNSKLTIAMYATLLVVAGVVVFLVPDKMIDHSHPGYSIGFILASIVNIHHYFTDGVVWKISSTEVRKDLFLHIEPT